MSPEFLYIVLPRANMTSSRLVEARRQLLKCNHDEEGREAAFAALDRYATGDLLFGDCGQITPDLETGIRYYIAGGITDGEDPSDEYTSLCHLDELYDLLLGWAREDGPVHDVLLPRQ